MQPSKLFTVSSTAILLAMAVSTPAKANSCKSEWIKAKEIVNKNGPKVMQGICNFFNKNDPQKAEKCLADYEKAKAEIDKAITKVNQTAGDSGFKVGPRGLGEHDWKRGNLRAQRTFIGPAIMSDSYTLDMERTGGKAKSTINGKVCFLDKDGNQRKVRQFTVSRSSAKANVKESGVAGLIPVVLLSTKFNPLKGHNYQVRGNSGGEPKIVKDARAVAGSGSGAKLNGRTFLIENVHSGKAMDASAPKQGANIHQWSVHNGANQRWRLEEMKPGLFRLVSKANNMCLDLQWANKKEGGNVFLWPCAANAWNMQYEFRAAGKQGEYKIYNPGSNKCLEVEKWYGHNGANIVQRSCNNNANQRWRLSPR